MAKKSPAPKERGPAKSTREQKAAEKKPQSKGGKKTGRKGK